MKVPIPVVSVFKGYNQAINIIFEQLNIMIDPGQTCSLSKASVSLSVNGDNKIKQPSKGYCKD